MRKFKIPKQPKKAKIEFKAKKDKHGRMTIMAHKEVKADGKVVMHVPSLQLIQEFNKNNR